MGFRDALTTMGYQGSGGTKVSLPRLEDGCVANHLAVRADAFCLMPRPGKSCWQQGAGLGNANGLIFPALPPATGRASDDGCTAAPVSANGAAATPESQPSP